MVFWSVYSYIVQRFNQQPELEDLKDHGMPTSSHIAMRFSILCIPCTGFCSQAFQFCLNFFQW